jgi:hypothetical protein
MSTSFSQPVVTTWVQVRHVGLTSVRQDSCASCARSCRSPPPARIRSPPLTLGRPADGIPIPMHAHSAWSVPPTRRRAVAVHRPEASRQDETRRDWSRSSPCAVCCQWAAPVLTVSFSPVPSLFFSFSPFHCYLSTSRSSSQNSRRHFGRSRRSAFPEVSWTALFTHCSREEKQIKIFWDRTVEALGYR